MTLDALRDPRELPRVRDAVQDLRQALRSLRKAPGFALLAVVTLASGLGATATVFSAVEALLLRPLAVEQPNELFVIRRAGETGTRFPLEFHRALADAGTVFADPIASFTFPATLVVGDSGTRARAAIVTANYFGVLGVRPASGRFFSSEQESDMVVISHRLWRERFGGRASAVGELVRVGLGTFVIVGVTPPDFSGLQLDIDLDLWVPMSAVGKAVPIPSLRPRVDIVGRVTAGLSVATATEHLNAAHGRWRDSLPGVSARGSAASLGLVSASHGLESVVRKEFRGSLGLLAGICASLWVITIVNVSGLLTARLSERSREVALRQALGASSSRLFIQFLTEVIVLAAGGLVLGFLTTAVLSSVIPRAVPSWAGVYLHLSPTVFAAAAISGIVAAFVIALIQAVSIDRRSLISQLAPSLVQFGSGRRLRLSTCLVGAQLGLTLPLIVVAGLLAQSLSRLDLVDTGFDRSNLLQISVEPALAGYSRERASAYYGELTERLRTLPGIVDASVSAGGALSGYDGIARLRTEGGPREVITNAVDERYFSTMGIRLLAGRSFDAVEARTNTPVVVVNDALARELFTMNDRAIGQVVAFEEGASSDQRTVIGVVENTADRSLREPSTPIAYLPVADSGLLVVHVKASDETPATLSSVRRTATSLDPTVPILRIESMEGRRVNALQRERLLRTTSMAIAWVALGLSAIGLFGHVNRAVIAHARDIVIRSALGASRYQIARKYFRETWTTLFFSAIPGLALAFVVARGVRGHVFGVSETEPRLYIGAAMILAVVATVATVLPLRRALRAATATHLFRV